jgi:hypothetical protein
MRIGRALLVWMGIAAVAVVNGAFRERVLVPVAGGPAAEAISPVILGVVILLAAFATLEWITRIPRRDCWPVGILWAGLAIGFDIAIGMYETGQSARQVIAGFGPPALAVFVVTLVAPALAASATSRRQYDQRTYDHSRAR